PLFELTKQLTPHIKALNEKLQHLPFTKKQIPQPENTYKNYPTIIPSTFKNIPHLIPKHNKINTNITLPTIKPLQSLTEQILKTIN
ncbi:hypothetical protein, partial [Staphylococcus epidermidis]|uniref:hypothetical protein n=1 Tax=Staphylococcus epidermidis TaxID=1282 RepID=UPI001C9354BD